MFGGVPSVTVSGRMKGMCQWLVLTFLACDPDENVGADAQEGECDEELDEGAAFVVQAEAGQVDEGGAGPAVEHERQENGRDVALMRESFFLVVQKHHLGGEGRIWEGL